MAVNKVIYDSEVLIDLTDDTVNASSLKQGYTAHDCHGNLITGTHVASGGSSGAGLPDTIEAGDTPIWGKYKKLTTSSSSTSTQALNIGRFVVPKDGTYRFTFIGMASGTSGNKPMVELSTASNRAYNADITGVRNSEGTAGATFVHLPYSNATDAEISPWIEATLTAGKKIWFFGKSGTGFASGNVGNTGTIYGVIVSIAWDNGTNNS